MEDDAGPAFARTGAIATRTWRRSFDRWTLNERGITIKAHPVTMLYKAKNGETYG